MDLNIKELLLYSNTIQKVERLWVDSPSVLAYYRLKGYQLECGILDTDCVEVDDGFLYCGGTKDILIRIRKQFPGITKEELIDMLRKRVDGQKV